MQQEFNHCVELHQPSYYSLKTNCTTKRVITKEQTVILLPEFHTLPPPHDRNFFAIDSLIVHEDTEAKYKPESNKLPVCMGDCLVVSIPTKSTIDDTYKFTFLTPLEIESQMAIIKKYSSDIKLYLSLPPKKCLHDFTGSKVLALDLDETLIYSVPFTHKLSSKICLEVHNKGGSKTRVIPRPYLTQFLRNMKEIYKLVVYTSSDKSYAEPILKAIDPKHELFSLELYRFNCVSVNDEFYMKNLNLLGDLSQVVIIDDNISSFAMHLDNGICIKHFIGQKEDDELNGLEEILFKLAKCSDVRDELRNTFKYSEALRSQK